MTGSCAKLCAKLSSVFCCGSKASEERPIVVGPPQDFSVVTNTGTRDFGQPIESTQSYQAGGSPS